MRELSIRAVESAFAFDVQNGFAKLADSLAVASNDEAREEAREHFKRRLASALRAHMAALDVIEETIGSTE